MDVLRTAKTAIEPALDAIVRNTKSPPKRSPPSISSSTVAEPRRPRSRSIIPPQQKKVAAKPDTIFDRPESEALEPRQKRSYKPREIEEFPAPLFNEWIDPSPFPEALDLHMRRHGDSYWHLHRALIREDEILDHSTIRHWLQGSKAPRSVASMEVLARIERRYRLPVGYFKAKLPHPTRSTSGHVLDDIGTAERRRLAWHLPDDFNARSRNEQEEIWNGCGASSSAARPTTDGSRRPR